MSAHRHRSQRSSTAVWYTSLANCVSKRLMSSREGREQHKQEKVGIRVSDSLHQMLGFSALPSLSACLLPGCSMSWMPSMATLTDLSASLLFLLEAVSSIRANLQAEQWNMLYYQMLAIFHSFAKCIFFNVKACCRLLLISLTDGKVTAKAMEFKTLTHVDITQLLPGTKIQLTNATCCCGCILLDPKSFRVRSSW